MDESRFHQLMRRAKLISSDYAAGYQTGLRRHYHGETFGTESDHEVRSRMGLDGDPRVELGRGYRDGLQGVDFVPSIDGEA
jgi:hypothetical protein